MGKRPEKGSAKSQSQDASDLRCSFCNKSRAEVTKLIAGPTVFICNECVAICLDILSEQDRLCALCDRKVDEKHRITVHERVVCEACLHAMESQQSKTVDRVEGDPEEVKTSRDDPLCCSFCNKSQREVMLLVKGPTGLICNECVDVCLEIIDQEQERLNQQKWGHCDLCDRVYRPQNGITLKWLRICEGCKSRRRCMNRVACLCSQTICKKSVNPPPTGLRPSAANGWMNVVES